MVLFRQHVKNKISLVFDFINGDIRCRMCKN